MGVKLETSLEKQRLSGIKLLAGAVTRIGLSSHEESEHNFLRGHVHRSELLKAERQLMPRCGLSFTLRPFQTSVRFRRPYVSDVRTLRMSVSFTLASGRREILQVPQRFITLHARVHIRYS